MIIVSLIGIIVEPLLITGVLRPKSEAYIRVWFWLAGFTVTFSSLLAISFLLRSLGTFYIGENWYMNAMCALADIVFFFVPDYFLGPRLQPVLVALLIIAHFSLPILHALSFYVVYSFYRQRHMYYYHQDASRQSGTPNVPPSCPDAGGRRSTTPVILDDGTPYKPKLCQKCQHAAVIAKSVEALQENGGYRCNEALLGETPIETTC